MAQQDELPLIFSIGDSESEPEKSDPITQLGQILCGPGPPRGEGRKHRGHARPRFHARTRPHPSSVRPHTRACSCIAGHGPGC